MDYKQQGVEYSGVQVLESFEHSENQTELGL